MKMLRLFTLTSFLFVIGVSTSFAIIEVPNDYLTIQEAINSATDGDTVLVDEGTYPENIDFLGKDIVVTSQYLFTEDSTTIVNTVINANYVGSCVKMVSGETEAAVLMGFTLINGTGSLYQPGYGNFYVGGGIYLLNSSPTIQYNIIRNNDTVDGGSGIFTAEGDPIIQYNTIVENTTLIYSCGAGILIKNTEDAVIAHNYIQYNTAVQGGGIGFKHASPLVTRNVISNNTAISNGGGLKMYSGSSPSIINNTISDNESPVGMGGGVLVADSSAPVFMNNIVSFTICGGGFKVAGAGVPELSYNLFYENVGGDYINCVPGIGDITGDPAYIGGDPFDYHLTATSAAIDAGNPDPTYNDPDGTRNDCGAFPYDQTPPTPVVLTSFSAAIVNDGVMLNWNTTCEIECYGWTVQRSQGSEFRDISPLIAGYGTTTEPHNYSYLDATVPAGQLVQYRLKQMDIGGQVTYFNPITVTFGAATVTEYSLKSNYPNPFNPETAIVYTLPENSQVRVTIYNATGQRVAELVNGYRTAGMHTITWNADNLPSGSYICRMEVAGENYSRILTLLK